MKLQVINDTAVDLAKTSPWIPGTTAVAVNLTAGSLVVQTSDDGVTYGTAATCGASTSATAMQSFTLKRYVKVSTAATMFILTSQ
jgi:hypothetical protein